MEASKYVGISLGGAKWIEGQWGPWPHILTSSDCESRWNDIYREHIYMSQMTNLLYGFKALWELTSFTLGVKVKLNFPYNKRITIQLLPAQCMRWNLKSTTTDQGQIIKATFSVNWPSSDSMKTLKEYAVYSTWGPNFNIGSI